MESMSRRLKLKKITFIRQFLRKLQTQTFFLEVHARLHYKGGKGDTGSEEIERGGEREGGRERERDVEVISFLQTCSEALREASLMAYCGKAINY